LQTCRKFSANTCIDEEIEADFSAVASCSLDSMPECCQQSTWASLSSQECACVTNQQKPLHLLYNAWSCVFCNRLLWNNSSLCFYLTFHWNVRVNQPTIYQMKHSIHVIYPQWKWREWLYMVAQDQPSFQRNEPIY